MCPFHLRPISSHLARSFRRNSDLPSKRIPLNTLEVMEALRVWLSPLKLAQGVSSSGSPCSRPNPDHGCLQLGLGGSPARVFVESQGVSSPCQPSGSPCGVPRSPDLRAESSSQGPLGSDRQHYSPVLSEPEGRDQVPFAQSADSRDHSVVPGQGHHSSRGPSIRNRQCRRRSSVLPADRSSVSVGEISRVVSVYSSKNKIKIKLV